MKVAKVIHGERGLRATFDLAPVGIAHVGLEGRIELANRKLCQMLGYPDGGLTGCSVWELSHPDDRGATLEPRRRMYAGDIAEFSLRKRYLRRDGGVLWVEVTVSLVRQASGAPQYEIAIYDDVTEKMRVEELLRASESRLRAIVGNEPECVKLIDADGLLLEMNPAGLRMIEAEEFAAVAGHCMYPLIVPECRESFRTMIERVCAGERAIMEFEIVGLKGTRRWLETHAVPAHDSASGRALALAISRDVTARKAAESAADRLKRLYAALSATNELIVRAGGVEELFQGVCRVAVEHGGFKLAAVRVLDAAEGWLKPVAWHGAGADYLQRSRISINPDIAEGQGPGGIAARSGRYTVSNDFLSEAGLGPWHREAAASGMAATACFPLPRGGRVFGLLNLYAGEKNAFDEQMAQLLERMAQNLSFALDNFDRDAQREAAERALRESEQQLALITDAVPAMIAYYDQDVRLRYANRQHAEFYSYALADRLGKHMRETIGEQAWNEVRPYFDRAYAGETLSYERTVRRLGREPAHIDVHFAPHRAESGSVVGLYVMVTDITERAVAAKALRASEERFRALTELSSDVFWETDAEHRITQVSDGGGVSGIMPVNELIGRRRWEIPAVVPDAEGWRAHRATLDAHLPFRDFENARRASDGSVRHFSLSGEPLFDAGGVFTGYRGVGREITRQKASEARLDQLAHYDELTGLPNRALIHDRLRQAMARAERSQTLLAVMFLDLDRFKEINDSLGHAAGDAVLKEAARRLQSCLRSTDTVGRLGGDEFTVLLEEVRHVDEISVVAGKIIDAFAAQAEVAGHELHLSASIGVSVYPLDNEDADTLLKNADMAMYQAKQEGRNNVQFFAAEMGAHTEHRADLRLRLYRALERGEFALHYQPQVGLAGGEVFGVEALLRWHDAELGPVSPGQFIPVAEETGLIVRIGDWVLREACRQCKVWLDAGLGPLRVAVNLSPRQFRQEKLAQRIGEILRDTGLPAACLEVEITEGIVMQHAERAIKTLDELNRLGVQIAIDDFGTGYSSLAYLQRFPVHVLKIDQSFVQAIRAGTGEAAIVNTVIHLAKLLGLQALAEGVETVQQRDYLRAHGCDAFQGYLFCKPQPAGQIGELLAVHRRGKAPA